MAESRAKTQKAFPPIGRGRSRRGQEETARRRSQQWAPTPSSNPPAVGHAPTRSQTAPLFREEDTAWEKRRGAGSQSHDGREGDMYHHHHMSQSSIGPETFSTAPPAPTLRAKRPGYDPTLSRKKSSKRKAEDIAREREVRAMSSAIPTLKRPATYSGSGPLRRDIRQIPNDLHRRRERPTSEISLPLPESIPEADDLSHQASFKIGIFAALSPRPTVKYVGNPRSVAGKQPVRAMPTVHQAIEEEDPASKKRINELADDLDAGGLRELMERDRRRRERRKEEDKIRLHRQLQRKANRQREEEAVRAAPRERSTARLNETRSRQPGGHSPPTIEGDAPGGVARESGPPPNPGAAVRDSFTDPGRRPVHHIRNPFEIESEVDLLHDHPFTTDEEEESAVPVRSVLRTVTPVDVQSVQKPSQATLSPPRSPVDRPTDGQSLSQGSFLGREITPEIPEHGRLDRRASDQSNSQQLNSWTNFFRRGGRPKTSTADRGRSTPSEFSNTSRESFARKQPRPIAAPRTFRRSDSAVPPRTMSKFREDLPDFPISPPDSRVQSPEVPLVHHAATASQTSSRQLRQSLSGTLDARSSATSSSNPTLDRPTLDRGLPGSRVHPPQCMDVDVTGHETSGGAAAVSQSLASVDSEASWLSGKPVKRSSGGAMGHQLHQSQSSLPKRMPGAYEPDDDDGPLLADDEYLSRLSPVSPQDRHDSVASVGRKASSTLIDLEREREQAGVPRIPAAPDETWHGSLGRQATIVSQASPARSREGLLNEYGDAPHGPSSSASSDSGDGTRLAEDPDSPDVEWQEAPILRARSVEYKGHVRRISAGSAKLLDIRRSSVQSSRSTPRSSLIAQVQSRAERRQSATTREL